MSISLVFVTSSAMRLSSSSSVSFFMGIPFGDGCVDLHRKPTGVPALTEKAVSHV